jgi:prevent-host-death family protein
VLEIAGRLWRVQCKWGRVSEDGTVVIVPTRCSWLSTSGYVRSSYTAEEVDLFGVYCVDLDRSFLLPISLVAGMSSIYLRLSPPRNSQRACINLADDFEFNGAVAQLGERRHGMAEVRGSIPLSSTPPSPTIVGSNAFRDGFGDWMDRAAAGEPLLITRRGRPLVRVTGPP